MVIYSVSFLLSVSIVPFFQRFTMASHLAWTSGNWKCQRCCAIIKKYFCQSIDQIMFQYKHHEHNILCHRGINIRHKHLVISHTKKSKCWLKIAFWTYEKFWNNTLLKLNIGKRVFLICTASGWLITALYKHIVKMWTTWLLGRDWEEN